MELSRLIDVLSDPAVYPFPVARVEVRQTHISAVFLAGDVVYKIKKPIDLDFLDFRTLESRHHFCAEEVRLNRRLAPAVYLGVVPLAATASGLKLEAAGEVVEWAVKMQRLPDDATLQAWLSRGAVGPEIVAALARKLAAFHAAAAAGPHIAAFGRFEVVARNARENFTQSRGHLGITLSAPVFERLQERTELALAELQPLIERRAARGVPRDTHGDLHLDHVYLFPERRPPDDLVIIDCIEFNERFRFADPVSDIAFLVMDFAFHGRRDLGRAFADAYFHAAGDDQGRALLPFYTSYRAAVRGKVDGFMLAEKEFPAPKRARALTRGRARWLLALGELERPERRPCLLLVGGLPGSGKSTLARTLAERAGFTVIRSDAVRKELAGIAGTSSERVPFGEGIYSPAWSVRTYAECLRRTEELLFEGKRVLVDASFRADDHRRTFLETATRWGVPGVLLLCRATPEVLRTRLAQRHGDVSDADWTIARQAAASWEAISAAVQPSLHELAADQEREQVLAQALTALRERELVV
jgi:hypothetical protein